MRQSITGRIDSETGNVGQDRLFCPFSKNYLWPGTPFGFGYVTNRICLALHDVQSARPSAMPLIRRQARSRFMKKDTGICSNTGKIVFPSRQRIYRTDNRFVSISIFPDIMILSLVIGAQILCCREISSAPTGQDRMTKLTCECGYTYELLSNWPLMTYLIGIYK